MPLADAPLGTDKHPHIASATTRLRSIMLLKYTYVVT
jgi:hypothetical protein